MVNETMGSFYTFMLNGQLQIATSHQIESIIHFRYRPRLVLTSTRHKVANKRFPMIKPGMKLTSSLEW